MSSSTSKSVIVSFPEFSMNRGHRKVCIQNYGKEGQGILNGFGFLRTDSCPTGIQEKAF